MLIDIVCTLLMSCFVSFARYMGPGKFFHSPLDLHPSSSYTIRRGSWKFFLIWSYRWATALCSPLSDLYKTSVLTGLSLPTTQDVSSSVFHPSGFL